MALIIDPDSLSQGTSTTVTDMVFSLSSGTTTTISSTLNGLPALAVDEIFEVREHSVVGNNGLYEVDTVTESLGEYICTKLSGPNPANASSEAAKTLGATGASTEKSVFFDTSLNNIWLIPQGNLTNVGGGADTGVTLQALYSFIKEEWKNDPVLIPFAFPMVAITPEQFEFTDGWNPVDNNSRKLIRTGGWKEYDTNDILLQEWTGIVTLGTFEDSTNDQAYYQVGTDPTDTAAGISFTYKGPVNEPIEVFEEKVGPNASLNFGTTTITRGSGSWITDGFRIGSKVTIRAAEDSGNDGTYSISNLSDTVLTITGDTFTTNADDDTAVVAYNHRSAIKLFLRVRDADTYGKTYSQSKLSDIGVTTVDNKVFRFPLANATDLKVAETDGNIAANSPYTAIRVGYLTTTYNREVDSATDRNFGIVIDVGTYSQSNGASNGTTLFTSASIGTVTLSDFASGTLYIHEGTDQGTHTISGTPVNNSGTLEITLSSALSGTESNLSFTMQRASPVSATAEEIYEKVQYLLRQASDIDRSTNVVTGKTADALLSFVGDTLKAGVSIPTNPNGAGSGVIIEGFDQDDTNRLVFVDNAGTERMYPFVASGSISFNSNLVTDGDGYYWMFYQYTERFTNTGFSIGSASGPNATLTSTTTNLVTELANGDYIALDGFVADADNGVWRCTGAPGGSGPWTITMTKVDGQSAVNESAGATVSLDKNPINSPDAIIVQDNGDVDIKGAIAGSSVSFSYDYDGNTQGGRTAASDAAVIIRAIGLDTAQFVETTGTITRATGLSFSVVSGLERNYSNP